MKVLITGRLPEDILASIKREHEVEYNEKDIPMSRDLILEKVVDKDGILSMITDRIDKELMDRAPKLKIIANFGVGFNNIDVEYATKKGIMVTNTPGVLTDSTADIAMALMLSVCRRIIEGDRMIREGRFRFWAPMHFLGREMSGKTLGIIGLGRIGMAVSKRAKGFDMQIFYFKRKRLSEEEEAKLNVRYLPLDELLKSSDFVSLHVPLTSETYHLIGERELSLMKPTSYLINTARGPVVDEKALIKALKEGWIAGAGLDVYENEPEVPEELKEMHNVVLLPHIGSATEETRYRMAEMAARNLLSALRGEIPPNCINWPFH